MPDRLPLADVRIIDFTNAVAGPTCTHILGDMGADVVKVESPTARSAKAHGVPLDIVQENLRRYTGASDDPITVPSPTPRGTDAPGTPLPAPDVPDRPWNRLTNFNELNRSKRGIVLDVATPEGRDAFLRLAMVCDVVVENFAPRVVGNLGIDYAHVCTVRPDIIYVSMPAFGKSGPYRDRISYGPGIDAMSGLSHLTGYEGGPPMKPGNFYCDQNAGLTAALAVLAALDHRERTGEGQYVETAMIEGELQLIGEALLDAELNGRDHDRRGSRDTSMAPHGVYPCRPGLGSDAWIAIAVETDDQWRALCAVIGRPELAEDARFGDVVSRYRHQEQADAIIAAWTATRDRYDAMRALQAVGVPAGAALTMPDLHADPHVRARGVFRTVVHPEQGPIPHTRTAFKLSGYPTAGPRLPAPCFGQDNTAVMRDLLGLSAGQVAALEAAGIITDHPLPVAEG
jgi:crotonobetainyl-CoA:carnitine CoA-transferase CaiB-like acyl-CoA transferase